MVPLHPECMHVLFEAMELIKTGSPDGEKQCQPLMLSCWHQQRWQWLVPVQRGTRVPAQGQHRSPLLLPAVSRAMSMAQDRCHQVPVAQGEPGSIPSLCSISLILLVWGVTYGR